MSTSDDQLLGMEVSLEFAAGADFPSLHVPLPEKHPFYAMVGRVASEWAHLEHLLDVIIWDLAGIRGAFGACVTAQMMGSYNRFKTIITFLELFNAPPNILEIVKKTMKTSQGLGEKRNRIIHDPWYFGKDSQAPNQFRSMPYQAKTKQYGHDEVTEEYIKTVITDIRKLREYMMPVKESIAEAMHALRDKSPPPSA